MSKSTPHCDCEKTNTFIPVAKTKDDTCPKCGYFYVYIIPEIAAMKKVRADIKLKPKKKPLKKVSRSGIKGISWHTQTETWRVEIVRTPHKYYMGSFKDIESAKKELDRALRELSELGYIKGKSHKTWYIKKAV